jgi:hypothetical protein
MLSAMRTRRQRQFSATRTAVIESADEMIFQN